MRAARTAEDRHPRGRGVLALRLATAALGFALVGLALTDNSLLGGGEGFGLSQLALLVLGFGLGALCFAPVAWNARVLALLLSVGLTLTVAEVALRRVLGPRYHGSVQLDDRVLYRLKPGEQREYIRSAVNGGDHIQYRINADGYRGEELAKPANGPRVVVFGDSFIQAEFSRTEDTFAERLEVHLARALHSEVEVVNAGVAGYGPDQELRRMEDELNVLQPDLVIVAVYSGNDFGDLLRNKLYRLAPDGSLAANEFVVADDVVRRVSVRQRELILKQALRDALTRLRGDANASIPTGAEARRDRLEAALAQLEAEYRAYVVEGDDVVRELMRDPYNADVSVTPESDSARYRIALLEQILLRMQATTAAQEVPLLVVVIPSPIDVSEMHESGEVDVQRHPAYRRSALSDIVTELCSRHDIPVLDFFGPFHERGADALYLKGVDDHWNERGQDFAAELVTGFVVEQGVLRASDGRAR